MKFQTRLKIGDVLDNKSLCDEFKIANMGGMRRSKETNTLVLINDTTKGLYIDTWENNILRFIGTGKIGDQQLEGTQNKTLYESRENGVDVHLFEVHEQGKYQYSGGVELAEDPYQETQNGDDGKPRKVWVFPLRKIGSSSSTQSKNSSHKSLVGSSLTTGKKVYHCMYGEGSIAKNTDTKIYVQFEIGVRIFPLPAAITKKYLTEA